MNTYSVMALSALVSFVVGGGVLVASLAIYANKPNRLGYELLAWALAPLPLFTFIGVLSFL